MDAKFYIAGLNNLKSDGIFGLGIGNGSNNVFPNFLDELKTSGQIDDKVFGLDLSGIRNTVSSRLIIGDWHHDIVDKREEIVWKGLEPNPKYWEVEIDELAFGGHTFKNLHHGKVICV